MRDDCTHVVLFVDDELFVNDLLLFRRLAPKAQFIIVFRDIEDRHVVDKCVAIVADMSLYDNKASVFTDANIVARKLFTVI